MTKEEFFDLWLDDKVVYSRTGSVWNVDHVNFTDNRPTSFDISCFSREMELTFENKWMFELEV